MSHPTKSVAPGPDAAASFQTGGVTYACDAGSWLTVPIEIADILLQHGWIEVPSAFGVVGDQRYAPAGGSIGVTLTADTNLAAGTAVAVNSSGHAVQTWGPAPQYAGVSSTLFNSSATTAILPLSATSFVVFEPAVGATACSKDGSNNVTAGSQNTSDPFAGTQFVATSQGSVVGAAAKIDSTHFVTVYQNSGFTQSFVAVSTVAANVITSGTGAQIGSGAAVAGSTVAMLTSTLGVTFYEDVNVSNGYAQAFTVSGTTVTLGSQQLVMENMPGAGPNLVLPLTATTCLIVYIDANGNHITAVVASISGTTITLHTPVASGIDTSNSVNVVLLSATSFIVSVTYVGDGFKLVAGSISGSTVAFGSVVTTLGMRGSFAKLDSTHFVIGAHDGLFATPKVCSVSGTTITFVAGGAPALYGSYGDIIALSGSLIAFAAIDKSGISFAVFEGDNVGVVSTPIRLDGVTKVQLAGLDASTLAATVTDQLNNVTAKIITANTIASPPIGFVSNAVLSAGSATVLLSGSISGASGLTTGAEYFVNGDGTLTSSDTGVSAGVATSSTTLLSPGIGA